MCGTFILQTVDTHRYCFGSTFTSIRLDNRIDINVHLTDKTFSIGHFDCYGHTRTHTASAAGTRTM